MQNNNYIQETFLKRMELGIKRFFSFKSNDKLGILIALVVFFIVASILSPRFSNIQNLLNILRQNAMLGIVAIGMSVVILGGGVDLSVGAVVALCGLIAGYLKDFPFILIFSVVMSTGIIIGSINGFLIAKRRLEPFIVTLSMQIVIRGVCLFITGGGYIARVNTFAWLGSGRVGLISIPAIILICMYIVFHIIMTKTVFGRNIYAVGGNLNAAKLSGIKTDRIIVARHAICCGLCALAALINVSRLSTAEPNAAFGLESAAIACALVGGTSFLGGRGSISGTFIGLLIFAMLSNIFNLLGLKAAEQEIIKGAIIIIAVLWSQRQKAGKV